MKSRQSSTMARWAGGFCLSLLAIWGITAVSTENYCPETWVPELERNVQAAGWSFDYRTESWARTNFGEFGLAGIEDIREDPLPKVIIWGDSFIQASHVNDDRKVHARLTGLLAEDGGPPLAALSVGHNWWSLPDYHFHIPAYERAIRGCRLHVIHLFTLEDTLPDRNPGHRISLFLSEPELHFERYDNEYREIEVPARSNPLRNAVFRARLQFFLRMKKRGLELARLQGLRFRPGMQSASSVRKAPGDEWRDFTRPDWVSAETPLEAWRFVLKSLVEVTEVPVLFVYAPATPALDGGVVVEENAERDLAEAFAALCRENGCGFVSLEDSFRQYWKQTGKLPRGFSTSRPGEGHYNAEGHRLAAEAVHDWIRKNSHVVHPD